MYSKYPDIGQYHWVVVATYSEPHEATLLKTLLETEGVSCMVENYYVGLSQHKEYRIRVKVHMDQIHVTYQIMKEAGFIPEPLSEPNRFLVWFDTKTRNIPLLTKNRVETRLFVLTAIIAFICITLFLWLAGGLQ